MVKILALFCLLFSSVFSGQLRSFGAGGADYKRAKVFIPSGCVLKDSLGDILIECKNSWARAQVLRLELDCYEAAKTLVDLAGDEPRGLKVSGLGGEKIETRIPIKTARLKLQITPADASSPLPNIIICEHEIALSIFGSDEKLVEQIASNSLIEAF